ncbi:branched-chain amino acid ABC transporter permease [Actinoplanes sp. NPDC026619]|uniref:branched-chain amino acid ABC transporter permease n=1 Tax=Actinoplanes sp. NPDC026619 TaxID=3155798 RepID=UPI0034054270
MTATFTATPPHISTVTAASRRRRHLTRAAAALTAVVALAWPALVGPYPVTVAATALVFAVLAVSTHLLVGVAGLPAFGQAAYFGVGAYTAALLARAGHTLAVEQLAAATVAAGIIGAVTAPIVLRTRGTAFLMATLAVQSLAATAASQWRTVTGGDEGISTPSVVLWPGGPALTAPAFVYWWVLAVTALAGLGVAVLLRSRLILVMRGIGGHEPRMTALGHHVTARLIAGYTIAAALAGTGGALLVTVNQYISPADLGFDIASLALLAATIGAGSTIGAAIGAVLIVAVRDAAGISSGGATPLLLGVLFVLVAYHRPALATAARQLGRFREAGRD